MLGVLLLPLIALGMVQGIIACLLLAPLPVARPVLSLSKKTRTPIAWTIIGTVSVVLLVFLLASLYELGELHNHVSREGELDALHRRCLNFSELLTCLPGLCSCKCIDRQSVADRILPLPLQALRDKRMAQCGADRRQSAAVVCPSEACQCAQRP